MPNAQISVISLHVEIPPLADGMRSSLAIHLTVPPVPNAVPVATCDWISMRDNPKSASKGDLLGDIRMFCYETKLLTLA